MILTRQLASYLAMPVFIVDPEGNVIFFNEPAEAILGRAFEESGEMPLEEWTTAFHSKDEAGVALSSKGLPLMVALSEARPSHRRFWITGYDQIARYIEMMAFPLIGQRGRNLGAVAVCWEAKAQ